MAKQRMNWNTLLISVGIAIGAWAFKEQYKETRQTHDTLLRIEIKLADIEGHMGDYKGRFLAIEGEIQKLKDKKL